MITSTKVIDPFKLTPQQYREAYRMTMRKDGNMAYDLRRIRNPSINKVSIVEKAWLIQIRDESEVLLGQCLLDVSRYFKLEKAFGPYAQFYVRAYYRRQGLGSKLAHIACGIAEAENLGIIRGQKWDKRSEGFFRSLDGLIEI